jgi:RNA polymerase sigma-70 factor (ECF subfamily)
VIYKRKLSHLIHHKHIVYSFSDDELLSASPNDSSYEDMLIAMQSEEEKKRLLRRALQKLTSRQKELVRMRYFEEMSMDDIADKLNLSLRTIYNTIHSALSILRKEVGGKK